MTFFEVTEGVLFTAVMVAVEASISRHPRRAEVIRCCQLVIVVSFVLVALAKTGVGEFFVGLM